MVTAKIVQLKLKRLQRKAVILLVNGMYLCVLCSDLLLCDQNDRVVRQTKLRILIKHQLLLVIKGVDGNLCTKH